MDSQSSAWAKANPDRTRVYVQKYASANIEKEKARGAKYRDQNRAKINEKSKTRRRADPEKAKEILKRSRQKNPETALRAYAKRKSYGSLHVPKGTVIELMDRQQGSCHACGTDIRTEFHVDHIRALSQGGRHEKSNLQLLCVRCNCAKGAKDYVAFLVELWGEE